MHRCIISLADILFFSLLSSQRFIIETYAVKSFIDNLFYSQTFFMMENILELSSVFKLMNERLLRSRCYLID